jgi:hypothetical protein
MVRVMGKNNSVYVSHNGGGSPITYIRVKIILRTMHCLRAAEMEQTRKLVR